MAQMFKSYKEKAVNRVVELPVKHIFPNPHQPRSFFLDDEIKSLAQSISQNGILQPLTVRKSDDGYELISGERRLRASILAGKEHVPCIILNVSEKSSALLAIVENIQREDLTCFDEASAIQSLIQMCNITQEETATKLGLAQSTIANKLRLLKLSDLERELIIKNSLTERHARALLKVKDNSTRLEVIDKIVKYSMNVEKTEKYIEQLLESQQERDSFKKRAVLLRDVRLFLNTINKAIETIKMAGINANAKKVEKDKFIEYIITIPCDQIRRS